MTTTVGRIITLSTLNNEALDKLIHDGLTNGTIRQTILPWAAPVLFMGKKGRNLWPCFDYCKLNSVTVKKNYLLPRNMDLVDSLLNANRFTKLDLCNAYGNLCVAEGNKKLAFVCRARQFAPLSIPFGPTRALSYFQYSMQDIFLERIRKDIEAYLDDIMVYTQQDKDHNNMVDRVI